MSFFQNSLDDVALSVNPTFCKPHIPLRSMWG
ncbi:hypothetical protein Barb6XT_01419 [Bacteroidales bacterium Barb6XT]|nr:hypothetical protein Barb6XT_01419 [Bacteroidales bacterium Barb6XT]